MRSMLRSPVLFGNPKKQEYAVLTQPDGGKKVVWGNEFSVEIPEGSYKELDHNHPRGTSLSFDDLTMLNRIDKIVAKGKSGYTASKGPNYANLQAEYPKISDKVTNVPSWDIKPSNPESLINKELAKKGIITYSEDPLTNELFKRIK